MKVVAKMSLLPGSFLLKAHSVSYAPPKILHTAPPGISHRVWDGSAANVGMEGQIVRNVECLHSNIIIYMFKGGMRKLLESDRRQEKEHSQAWANYGDHNYGSMLETVYKTDLYSSTPFVPYK